MLKLYVTCCADIEDVEKHMPGFLRVSMSCAYEDVSLCVSACLFVCVALYLCKCVYAACFPHIHLTFNSIRLQHNITGLLHVV